MIEEVLGGLYDEIYCQPGAIVFAREALTIHFVYFGTAQLFQIRSVPHVADFFMNLPNRSMKCRA